jgi:hypothetical protein
MLIKENCMTGGCLRYFDLPHNVQSQVSQVTMDFHRVFCVKKYAELDVEQVPVILRIIVSKQQIR